VRYANAAGTERAVSIVGVDEVDLDRNHISWVSPLGRALMKSAEGDRVLLDPGTVYSAVQVGADVIINMTNAQMTLVNVTLSSLPQGWITA